MEHLHHTPRRSTRRAAIDANARLTAMLTPARGRRSTAGVSSAAKQQDAAAVVKNVSKDEFRDDDSLSSAESSETDEVECCICLEEPSADDIATINGCGHNFCYDCISQWSEANNVCPLCRTRFTSIESAGGVLLQVPERRTVVAAAVNLVGVFNLEENGVGGGGGNDDPLAVLQRLNEQSEATRQRIVERSEVTRQRLAEQSEALARFARSLEQSAVIRQDVVAFMDEERFAELNRILANLRAL